MSNQSTVDVSSLSADQALERISRSLEGVQKKMHYISEAASPNDYYPQGDLNIVVLEGVPKGAIPIDLSDVTSFQLAPGTSKGSRHTLDDVPNIRAYTIPDANNLQGPVIEILKKQPINHPEHGPVMCPPMVYGVYYQRKAGKEIERVRD